MELQRKVDQARPDKVLLCGGTKCNQLAICNLEWRHEGVYGSDYNILFFKFGAISIFKATGSAGKPMTHKQFTSVLNELIG